MTGFGDIAFLDPWALLGLLALIILWWLLRAVPTAPRRERFPGVRLLLGLPDREKTPIRTPWWLLLLRVAAIAALLVAFAEPILNPKPRLEGQGPLLIVMDAGWGSAPDWPDRRAAALDLVTQARESGRPVALSLLSAAGPAPTAIEPLDAESQARALAALEPAPWRPDPSRLMAAVAAAGALDTVWFHDGLDHPAFAGAGDGAEDSPVAALAEALAAKGPLTVIGPATSALALGPVGLSETGVTAPVLRADTAAEASVTVAAIGAGSAESGAAADRRLAAGQAAFDPGAELAVADIDLPVELRNALTRLEIPSQRHAGAVSLIDDRLRRRKVALVSGERGRAGLALLSGAHYLRAALAPHAAYREMSLIEALGGDPEFGLSTPSDAEDGQAAWADVIVVSDIGRFDAATEAALLDWVEQGGLLIRFAGPQLAAAVAEASTVTAFRSRSDQQASVDPLLPVRLRGGGRALGGALSWGAPQKLQPFEEGTPFAGIDAPREVEVSRQVLAEPSPELSGRVWARLEDGTPLVTARSMGAGRVALFHVTANAAWSTLPLSGLFVEMVGRMVAVAPALSASADALAEQAAIWRPEAVLDAYGGLSRADSGAVPVGGADLARGVQPGVAPGIYVSDGTDAPQRLALSAIGAEEALTPRPAAPAGSAVETLSADEEIPLKPYLLAFGLIALLLDALIALALSGRLRMAAGLMLAAALGAGLAPEGARAQSAEAPAAERIDPGERRAALETVMGYIQTGDPTVDRVSAAGLLGLSATLYERTAIEPGDPAAVDLETDELAVYAILYWPITRRQADLSDNAVRKLNAYMRSGGLLVVDTRDAHQTFGANEGPNASELRRLAGRLDLPPLAKAPRDHILTRSFYLLDAMPGRWSGGTVWVEARGPQATQAAGDARANANDGVSPIIIGAADWAGAWAIDDDGVPLFVMGRGGERQREVAWRFGVNMAMYAFTGNYKSDQVHIPALLQRLGN